jgi:hypothetical protein
MFSEIDCPVPFAACLVHETQPKPEIVVQVMIGAIRQSHINDVASVCDFSRFVTPCKYDALLGVGVSLSLISVCCSALRQSPVDERLIVSMTDQRVEQGGRCGLRGQLHVWPLLGKGEHACSDKCAT